MLDLVNRLTDRWQTSRTTSTIPMGKTDDFINFLS